MRATSRSTPDDSASPVPLPAGCLPCWSRYVEQDGETASDDVVERVSSRVQAGVRTFVTKREDILRKVRGMSPATNVSADDPPPILIHGDADKAVPPQQSRRLMDRLNSSQVPARLVLCEGMAHAWSGWEADAAFIADWFDKHLRSNAWSRQQVVGRTNRGGLDVVQDDRATGVRRCPRAAGGARTGWHRHHGDGSGF
jgi:acetyl esterase/lipase